MAASNQIRLPLFTGGLLLLFAILAVYSVNRGAEVEERHNDERAVSELRAAVSAYHIDHGFYPGSRRDFGYPLADEQLMAKLLQFTDANGQPNPVQTHRFRFGPYLSEFPVDPKHGSRELNWALGSEAEIAAADEGGWIYAPELGIFVARSDGLNLRNDLAGF